jgi:molybdenum cofactor cytidylyltransferase
MTTKAESLPGVGDSAVIVLLAAGASRRYGSPKQLAVVDGEPMLRRVARTALAARVPVLVVLGAHAETVRSALDGLSVRVVHCADWADGMGCSLASGASAVEQLFPDASGLLLCLADQPLIETQMFLQLLHRHHVAPRKILASGNHEALGPPVLFPRDCLAELAQWSGAGGARILLQRESYRVERCLADVGVDVDTPAALADVNRLLGARAT